MTKMYAEVELVKTNVDDGTVSSQKQHNTTTSRLLQKLALQTNGNVMGNANIAITDAKMKLTKVTLVSIPAAPFRTFLTYGDAPQGEYWPQLTNDAENKQYIFTFKKRYAAPTATRTINSIILSTESNSYQIAGLNLNTPCIQNTNEILDIFYRVYLSYDITDTTNPNYNAEYVKTYALLWKFFSNYSEGNRLYLPGTSNPAVTNNGFDLQNVAIGYNIDISNLGATGNTYTLNVDSAVTTITSTSNATQGSVRNTYNLGINDAVGSIFRKVGISTGNDYSTQWYSANRIMSLTDIVPEGTSRVQSVYLRAPGALSSNLAYLDASNIGNSLGSMELNDDAYTGDSEIPSMFRVNIVNGGTAANATYTYATRGCFGFTNNQYSTERREDLNFSFKTAAQSATHPFHSKFTDISGTPSWWFYSAVSVADDTHLLSFSSTGVSKINVYTQNYVSWDATTTPALNVTSISDVMAAPDGAIYVASITNGLSKISADGNTITKYTGIGASIDESKCYTIDITKEGDVWAVFDGGIAKLPAGSSSWTVYNADSTPALSHSFINNKWGNINRLSVNTSTAGVDKLAMFTRTENAIVWWSPTAQPTATSISSAVNDYFGYYNSNVYGRYKRYSTTFTDSDVWVFIGASTFRYAKFGDTAVTNIPAVPVTGSSQETYSGYNMREFKFDDGNYYIMIGNITNVSDGSIFYKIKNDGTFVENSGYSTWGGTSNYNYPSLIAIMNQYGTCAVSFYSGESAAYVPQLCNAISTSNSWSWKKYGWDGTDWVVGATTAKPMNTTAEELVDGLTIKFTGTGSTSDFIANEFWNGYFCEGLHKDNSTTAKFSFTRTARNTYRTSDVTATTIPSSAGTLTDTAYSFYSLDSANRVISYKGMVGEWNDTYMDTGAIEANTSEIINSGDFTLSFKSTPYSYYSSESTVNGNGRIGFYDADGSISWAYGIGFSGGKFYAYTSNVRRTTPATFENSDEFSIVRTGTTLSMQKNGVEFYTTEITATNLRGVVGFYDEYLLTFYDVKMTYTESRPAVFIGSSVSQTGIYDPKYAMVEGWDTSPPTLRVTIDGVPAQVITNPAATPPQGTVLLLQKMGMLVFNSADVGKTITSSALIMQEL